MWLSPAGNLETRPSIKPIVNIGTEAPIQGIYYFTLGSYLIVASDNKLFKVGGAFHVEEIGLLSGENERVSMCQFLGKVYIASGGVLQVYDGSTVSLVEPATGMVPTPELDFITEWQERLWGFKGDSLYASGYRAVDDFGTADPSVANFSTGGHMEIRPGDGTSITGLCVFQGSPYLTKGSANGRAGSFWTITGSSFVAETTDPFSAKLVNNGVGCINPFTMHSSLNTILFAGPDGNIFSESQLDQYVYPQSMPANNRVIPAFLGDNEVACAMYQPKLGYYMVVLRNGATKYHEIWANHVGTNSWWLWQITNTEPCFIASGEKDIVYIGDLSGIVHIIDTKIYGTDGGNNLTKIENVWSGLSFGILDANSTRDKFFEWLFVDYLPLGQAGQMWVDYREGRGYTYAYTASALSGGAQTAMTVGWDYAVSQWDVPEIGWDMGGTVEVMNRINRRTSTLQIALNANTPFRLIGVSITGGMIATRTRSWFRG